MPVTEPLFLGLIFVEQCVSRRRRLVLELMGLQFSGNNTGKLLQLKQTQRDLDSLAHARQQAGIIDPKSGLVRCFLNQLYGGLCKKWFI